MPHQPLKQVLDGTATWPPPIWLMRQAGRYLPEYRKVREQAGSFLDLCYNPELATEVTLQPLRRFDLDAAILFSDILVIPHALGQPVRFAKGEGPLLEPIDRDGIARLKQERVVERLQPVLDTVASIRGRLDKDKSLIGFCGAPWTVATYMIAGRGTPDQTPARLFGLSEPVAFADLLGLLADVSADYLIAQAEAGADVLQVFDSWSGVLGERDFVAWSIAPMKRIVAKIRAAVPRASIIGFPKGAGLMLERYVAETGVDAVGIDWTVPGAFARERLQPAVAVQGNLDPLSLMAGGGQMREAVGTILDDLGGGRLIFNLGHGIRPETPIDHVSDLVSMVKQAART